MRPVRRIITIALLSLLFLSGCRTKPDGAIEGSLVPPGIPAHITAIREGKNVLTVPAGAQNGKFKLTLAAGVYTIKVAVPESPYPLQFHNITVNSGETTVLPPIELSPPSGTGVLSGKTIPPCPDAEITILCEGKERAAMRTDPGGKYEFRELPTGTYLVRARTPGHAEDSAQVVVTDNQKKEQSVVLLPVSSIDGVDWASGKIRATGIGMPPPNAVNTTVRREMAKRAALADARRNMLRTVEQIRINAHENVKSAMRSKNVTINIEGFIEGAVIISERELEGGTFEIVLELPLNGPTGLTRYIAE